MIPREPMVRWLMLAGYVSNIGYSYPAPLLPLEILRHGLPGFYVGVAFAFYSLAHIIGAPLVGKRVDKFGYRNLITFGLCFMGSGFFAFGFIEDMENRVNLLAVVLLLRLVHGSGCTTFYTTMLSIATNDFPEDQERVIGNL